MIILHILSTLSHHAGTPKKVYNFIEKSKHTNLVFLLNPNFNNETNLKNGKVFITKSTNPFIIIKSIYHIIKENNVNIVHTYFNNALVFTSIAKLFGAKVKILRSFVGIEIKNKIIHDILVLIFIKDVSYFTFISNYVRSFYIAKWPNLLKKPNQIIFNGAILEKRIDRKPDETVTFLAISALNEYKNLFLLIETFNILINKKRLNYILYIVGEGHLRSSLEEKINAYGLDQNIILTGYEKNIEKYLNRAYLFLHPSDKEGFGIAVVEAMLAKVPVLVSKAGGLLEIITDNVNGFYADAYNPEDWANKIIYLIDNPDIVNLVAEEGFKHANTNYSMETFVRNFDDLYSEMH